MQVKNSKNKKFKIFSALIICSLFGYATTNLLIGSNYTNMVSESIFADDPLVGLSDAVGYCGTNGIALHEFYLCGTNDERALNLNIADAQQIIWYKLQEGSCDESDPGCPNTLIGCKWDQLSSSTQFNIDTEGEYRVNIQYINGDSDRHYFKVYTNGLNPSAVVSNLDCTGPGSITINNIPADYEFSINNGINWVNNNVFSIASTGVYDVLIRRKDNAEGCEFSVKNIAVNNNSINATSTVTPITCNTTKGSIAIAVADPSTNYIFNINQGGNLIHSSGPTSDAGYIFENLDVGNYDIEVTLASVSSCSWTSSITISDFNAILPNVVVSKNIDCSPGIITVSENGGNAPYEYSIDGGVSYTPFNAGDQTTIDIATAGTYTVTVKDSNGCEIDGTTKDVINEPEIIYTLTPTDVSCNGVDDGSIIIDISNSQGYSITFSIDGGTTFQTSKVFSNLTAATYPVVIKKEKAGSSCNVVHGDVVIASNPTFTVAANITQEIDCATGFAELEANVTTGGVAPFLYSLDGVTFQSNNDFPNLGAGEYIITVKDVINCLATATTTIDGGSNPTDISFSVTDVDCTAGLSDLLLTVNSTSTTATYTYEIVSPINLTSPDNTFIDLASGTYTFEVTADDGCKIKRNFTVPETSNFEVNATVIKNVSCFGSTTPDGSIDVTVNDFDTAYDFVINDNLGTPTGLGQTGITTNTINVSGFSAGSYTLIVNDATGSCSVEKIFEIKEPTTALTVATPMAANISNINCGSPGSISINASGGWGNYTYSVRQPDLVETTEQTSSVISGLDQLGVHTIIVKDINGCVDDSQTFSIEDNGGPTAVVDATSSNYCYSTLSSGELKIDITDGTAPFYYTINNGSPQNVTGTSFTLNGLTPDDYQIKVIGSNGCETLVDDTKIAGQLFAIASITKPLGCGASPDAIIAVTAQEGYPDPDYTFEVSTDGGGTYGPATMPYTATTADTYQFKVTDSKNCVVITDPVTTTVAPNLTVNPIITDTSCGEPGSGAVEFDVTGGTGPFEYSLDGGTSFTANLPVFNNLDAQDYDYVVRDNLGCEISGTITIGAGDPPSFNLDITDKDIECPATVGGAMQWGRIYVTNPVDAVAPYSIRLNLSNNRTISTYNNVNPAAAANQDASGNFSYDITMFWARTLYVEVEDARGCVWTSANFTVTQPELPVTHSGPAIELDGTPVVQSCTNGSPIFDLEITNALVGPFLYRIWPSTLVDSDDDGVFDDFGTYEPFDDTTNKHPKYDNTITGNRVMRFGAPHHDLLFGVEYRVIIYDEATGCYRWRTLGQIEVPSPGLDLTVQRQSLTCSTGSTGTIRMNVTNHDQTSDIDYEITVAGNPTNIIRSGTVSGAGSPVTIDETGLGRAWYVVAITDGSGCTTAERIFIDRPGSALGLNITSNIPANCFSGAQLTFVGTNGWNNESYFQARNNIDNTWRTYEYAVVPQNGTTFDPNTDAGYSTANSIELNPTAYDGIENVYTVYVRDASGCFVSQTVTVTKDSEPEITSIDVPDRCTSSNELYTVNAIIINGPGTNQYIWDGNVTNSATAILGPGNHTLTVRDGNGCEDTENIFIYPQMVSKANITQVELCDPPNSGEVTIEVYGGSTDYTFERLDTAEINTTGVFTGLAHSTTYDFSVTDNQSGCAVQFVSATLDAPDTPNFEARVLQHVSCNGGNEGSIIVEQTAGAANTDVVYEYSLNGGAYSASNLFENLIAGSYTVSVRSSKNCEQIITPDLVVTEPMVVSGSALASSFECNADNSLGIATVTATASGGTAPYAYSFNGSSYTNGNTFEIPFTNLAQTVTVDIIDANNCISTLPITAMVDAAVKVEATITETQAMNCEDDAIFEVSTTSGIGPFTITQLPGLSPQVAISGTTVTIDAGNPDTYVFEVYDTVTMCSTQVSYTALTFDNIDITNITKVNDISCESSSDGEFTFTVSGFTTDFSYEVYEAGNTTTPYIASQTGSSTTAVSVNGLPSGIYYIVVSDNDTACERKSNFITIQAPTFTLAFDSLEITRDIQCNPANDAEVIATAIGGWGTYEFQLVNMATSAVEQAFDANNVFGGLASGVTYQVTLRDGNGCDNVVQNITIPTITNIIIDNNPTVVQPTCFNTSDGSITVTAAGGQGSTHYQYVLNNLDIGVATAAQVNNTFDNLSEGQYTVTVSDDLGCSDVTPTIQLINPGKVVIDGFISAEPTCLSQGEITLNATGGSGSFEYRIISPAGSDTGWGVQNVYELDAGTYEFITRDVPNHCESPISVIRTIRNVDPLVVMVDDTNTTINCFGETDAVLVAEATGGLGGYQYQLEKNGALVGSPQDSGVFENLGAGTYRIFATGGLECETYSDAVTIVDPAELIADLGNASGINCFGEETGTIEINVTNGEAPFTYIISSEPSKAVDTPLFENLPAGNDYFVIVQDKNGCELRIENIEITGPTAALKAEVLRVENEVCSSDNNGLIEILITGGTTPYSYNLTEPTDGFDTFTGTTLILDTLDSGDYIVNIKDANGCETILIQQVLIGSNLSATVASESLCTNGYPLYNATAVLDDPAQDTTNLAFGLDDVDPYDTDFTDYQTSPNFKNLRPGEHTISIFDSVSGCLEVVSFTIEEQEELVLINKTREINQIFVQANGGDGNYTYYFNNVPQTEGSYFVNTSGEYIVKVVDGKGCEAELIIPMEFIDIEIPNFFTPNGDGQNDTWSIKNTGGFPKMYVMVFDRSGRKLTEFIGQGEWDGTYNNENLPTGDYWYIIKLNGRNDLRDFIGHFSVYR
ncbi:T9SS type B sorting domain-containing protein [Maribacter sp. IgM3_T14_3]|uniref:T9SS type B sorting domain-containing protein n=1 Tax=Maribacter sp. IgM3_T14_3 TaxID=3415140 RepID=UPI003C6EDEE1